MNKNNNTNHKKAGEKDLPDNFIGKAANAKVNRRDFLKKLGTAYAVALAGPLLFLGLALLLAPHVRAVEWIPPRPVSAWLPGAAIAPGNTATLELVLRSNGPATSVEWSVAGAGNFACTVTPSTGALVLGAGSLDRIPLSVAVPPAAPGLGTITATVTYANGGGLAAKSAGTIVAATNSRPEIWPLAPTWSGAGGSSGNISFQIRSRTAGPRRSF